MLELENKQRSLSNTFSSFFLSLFQIETHKSSLPAKDLDVLLQVTEHDCPIRRCWHEDTDHGFSFKALCCFITLYSVYFHLLLFKEYFHPLL
jgi:hypothetical protein